MVQVTNKSTSFHYFGFLAKAMQDDDFERQIAGTIFLSDVEVHSVSAGLCMAF